LEQPSTITHLKTQVVRSLSHWSGGIGTENSIVIAYISLITNAQKFIYIENQFLITKIDEESTESPRSRIGRAIVNRIKRAYLENEECEVDFENN
jgi:phospholipase D1/2